MKNLFAALLVSLAVSPFVFAQSATNLQVTKSGPPDAMPGDDVSYTVTVANISGVDAAAVTLADTTPAEMTFVSAAGPGSFVCTTPSAGAAGTVTCTGALLAAGASATFTFVFEVAPDTSPGTIVSNTADVSSETPDSNTANNSATAETIIPGMDLQVTKTGPAEAAAGADVAYTVTVTNISAVDAESVTVSDSIPAGMTFVSASAPAGFDCMTPAVGDPGGVSCSTPLLAAGASGSFTFVFKIDAETPPGTVFTNFATASSETFDANEENNTGVATTTTTPPPPGDLSVQKSAPSAAADDTDVAFTITLTNAGPSPAENVILTDNLPAPLTFVSFTQTSGPTMSCGTSTCTIASFPAFATATFELIGHVPAEIPGGTVITNTAFVTSDNDPNDENNSGTTTVVVSSADISVVKTGAPAITAGQNLVYTITVTNPGPDAALGVLLFDTLPPGTTFVSISPACTVNGSISCEIGTMSPGATVVYTLTVLVGDTTSISNTATVTTGSVDPDTTNNSSTATTAVTPQADLAVTKSGASSVTAGTNIAWTVTLTNNGPSTAQSVTLTDTLPAGTTFVSIVQTTGPAFACGQAAGVITCTSPTLAPLATATFTVTAAVGIATTGSITNTANMTTATTDPNSQNNLATAVAAVGIPPADVSITKTANAPELFVGTNAIFTIVARNNGPGPADNVVVTDTLPAGVTLVSAPGCTGTTTLTCNVGTLTAGATVTFTIAVTLPSTPGNVSNTATVTSSTNDPATGNNASTAPLNAVAIPAGIPTLSTWGLLLLIGALAAAVALRLR